MRKNRKFLQTDFIKFILEKYSEDGQDLPDEDEVPVPNEETNEPPNRKYRNIKSVNEFDDEVQDEKEPISDEEDDEIIDELLNEYKRLKKKYESTKFHKRRK